MTTTYNVPTARYSEDLQDHLWMENGGYADSTADEVVGYMWQHYLQLSPTNQEDWVLQDMRKYYEGLNDGLNPADAEEKALCDIPF